MTYLRRIAASVCVLLLVTAAWLPLLLGLPKCLFIQSDTFWLLETGRYIAEHHVVPTTDIYSFTKLGCPWVVYQWLFDLALWQFFQVGGWLALSLLTMVFIALFCFWAMLRGAIQFGSNSIAALIVIWLAVTALMPDFAAIRPQLLTFCLLWLTHQILEADRQTKPSNGTINRRLLWLPLLLLIWVNIHLSFVMLLGILAIYTVSEIAASLVRKENPANRRTISLVCTTVACLLLSAVNPHAWGLFEFFLRSWPDHTIVPELRPLTIHERPALIAYIFIASASILASLKQGSVARAVTAAIFLVAGLRGARFILYFIVWTAPISAEMCTAACRRLIAVEPIHKLSQTLTAFIESRIYVALLVTLSAAITILSPTVFPLSIPVQACEFLSTHRFKGRLFCGEHAGSYLIHRFHGTLPVFIDTRADVYGRQFCDRFCRTMLTGQQCQELMNSYHINVALVPNGYRLTNELATSEQWCLRYQDAAYSIFERSSNPANVNLP